MESPRLYQDDLTEERMPPPAQRDDVAHTTVLDPDTLEPDDVGRIDDVDDGDDDDEDDDDLEDDDEDDGD